MLSNFVDGTVIFDINGESLGEAHRSEQIINGEYVMAISLCYKSINITLINPPSLP